MTPADRQAMICDWCAWHMGAIPEWIMPQPSPAFERGFAAGLVHAREQSAIHLDARAAEVAQCDCTQCSNAAAELREQAAKIRSGE